MLRNRPKELNKDPGRDVESEGKAAAELKNLSVKPEPEIAGTISVYSHGKICVLEVDFCEKIIPVKEANGRP